MTTRRILAVTVVYDDTTTETFTGMGKISHTNTYVTQEEWDFSAEPHPELKKKDVPVKYLTIGMTQ